MTTYIVRANGVTLGELKIEDTELRLLLEEGYHFTLEPDLSRSGTLMDLQLTHPRKPVLTHVTPTYSEYTVEYPETD